METVIKYKAVDGTTFDTKKSCLDYDTLFTKIDKIMEKLKPVPKDDTCNFANGEGYVQQSPAVFHDVKNAFLDLATDFLKADARKILLGSKRWRPSQWRGR